MNEMIGLEKKGYSANWKISPLGEVIKPIRLRVKPNEYPDLPFIGMEHIEAHTDEIARNCKSGNDDKFSHFFSSR